MPFRGRTILPFIIAILGALLCFGFNSLELFGTTSGKIGMIMLIAGALWILAEFFFAYINRPREGNREMNINDV